MPFSAEIDGTVTKGETKEVGVSPERQDGTFFVPKSLTLTVTFQDDTTTTKDLNDFSREGDELVVPVDFDVSGTAEIDIEVEDSKGNVEQITPADGATVFVA
jgi:hypothetical protein